MKAAAGMAVAMAPGITPSSITRPSCTRLALRISMMPVMQGPGCGSGVMSVLLPRPTPFRFV